MEKKNKLYVLMKAHSQFVNKDEFNEWKKEVRYCHSDQLSDTNKQVIDTLSKYAVNEKLQSFGVACPLVETLAAAIDKSIRTIRRSTAKLEKLGILKRIATKERHKQGGYSANLYVFLKAAVTIDRMDDRMHLSACENAGTPTAASVEGVKIDKEALYPFDTPSKPKIKRYTKTYNTKDRTFLVHKSVNHLGNQSEAAHNARHVSTQVEQSLDFTYARNDIPATFIHAVMLRSGLAKDINFAWTKVTLAYHKSGLHHLYALDTLLQDNDVLNEICQRARSVVRAEKLGEIRKDFGALMYGTMLEMFNRIADEDYSAIIDEMSSTADEDLFTGASLLLSNGSLLKGWVQRTVSHRACNDAISNAELDALGVF